MFRSHPSTRVEKRIPMAVAVRISGHAAQPGEETTFTEDVSFRGARVLSNRRWQANERLLLATLSGSFRSVARVAWCRPVRDEGFALGLQLAETSGNWVVAPASAATKAIAS